MAKQMQPIFILPEGSERTTGRDAQKNNIMAASTNTQRYLRKSSLVLICLCPSATLAESGILRFRISPPYSSNGLP